MLRHKDRTAILKRQYRSLISPNLLRNINNFLLIHPNQRPIHRHRANLIRSRQRLHRLRSHLPDTLPRNQPQTLRIRRDPLRDPHHIPPHNNRQLIMRALLINMQLNIRKIHHMQIDRPAVLSNLLRQIHHLLLRPLTRIRRRMKINRVYLNPSLSDHIPCHR